MTVGGSERPVAIIAGGGELPQLVTAAAFREGRAPVVFAIAGEAEPRSFGSAPVHIVRWGEIGRLLQLTEERGCREAVLIGSITHRPDYRALRPDLATIKLIPRIMRLMGDRDGNLLAGVTHLFEEHGIRVVSPLAIAPDLALPEGCLVGEVSSDSARDIKVARRAAREIGARDIAQAAIAIGGEVAAEEDASGTDAMLERVAQLRGSGKITKPGGVLVKCLKPLQDGRLDLPTIGPRTAEKAAAAGLAGVAAEAGRAILAGRDETVAAFRSAGLFLAGLKAAPQSGHG